MQFNTRHVPQWRWTYQREDYSDQQEGKQKDKEQFPGELIRTRISYVSFAQWQKVMRKRHWVVGEL